MKYLTFIIIILNFINITNGQTICLNSPIFSPVYSNYVIMGGYETRTGDFNNDLRKDFILRPTVNNSVSLILSNGTTTYSQPSNIVCSNNVGCIEVADFNNDGNDDFVFGDYSSNLIGVLHGNGAGSFTQSLTYTVSGNHVGYLNCSDINSDGLIDIVSGNLANFNVFINNGSGGFSLSNTYSVNGTVSYIICEDLNNDSKNDLYISTENNNSNWQGNGNGTFSLTSSIQPISFCFDLNNDGKLDAFSLNSSSISIALNQGNFIFGSPTNISSGVSAIGAFKKIDINSDNKKDIVVADYNNGNFAIHLNNGFGGLNTPFTYSPIPGGIFIEGMITDDIDNNGKEDLIYQIGNIQDIRILYNCLSTNNEEFQIGNNSLEINPNPSNGIFKITANRKLNKCEVFNINGDLLMNLNEVNELNLSKYPNGIYFIKIETNDGLIVNQKLIKSD